MITMPKPRKFPKEEEGRLQLDQSSRLLLASRKRSDESYEDLLIRLITQYINRD